MRGSPTARHFAAVCLAGLVFSIAYTFVIWLTLDGVKG